MNYRELMALINAGILLGQAAEFSPVENWVEAEQQAKRADLLSQLASLSRFLLHQNVSPEAHTILMDVHIRVFDMLSDRFSEQACKRMVDEVRHGINRYQNQHVRAAS